MVRADSQEAIRRCKERKRGGGKMMAGKIRELWREARRRKIEVKMEWVRGHAKVWGNEEADKLSKEGAKSRGRENEDAFVSEAWMLRKAKEETVKEWTRKWEKEIPRQGREY